MLQGNSWDSISERKPRAVDIGEGKPGAVYTDSRENLLVLGSITTWSYASSLLSASLEDTNLSENSNWGCFWNNWSWRLSDGLLFGVLSKMNLRMRKTCWKVHLLRRQQKFLDRESLNLVLAELSFFFFSDHHSDVTQSIFCRILSSFQSITRGLPRRDLQSCYASASRPDCVEHFVYILYQCQSFWIVA